jgi:RNA polymerase sigma factor (TIGR02999 family)
MSHREFRRRDVQSGGKATGYRSEPSRLPAGSTRQDCRGPWPAAGELVNLVSSCRPPNGMGETRANDVTGLLAAWREGDADAAQALAGLVYEDLRAMAARRLAGGRSQPLQTTELVHEAFARLLERPLQVQDRAHFFRTLALMLRQVLTDAIRRERAEKRGGDMFAVSLSAAGELAVAGPDTWLGIDAALAELERLDARKCRVVEMSLLLGIEQAEIAETLGVSLPTVERDLRFARAWLRDRIAH